MNPESTLKIAAIQPDIIWQDKSGNFNKILKLADKIEKDVDLILLPETFATGFTMDSFRFAEDQNGETESFLVELARKKKALTGGGWIQKKTDGNPSNTFTILDENGEIYSRYEKIHPFALAGENLHYSSGNKLSSFSYKGFTISSAVCYDLRFPELFRKTAGKTDLYIIIANWPASRSEHWLTLLKARAIENQAFVIGVNRVGLSGSKSVIPHKGLTICFDAFGNGIQLGEEEGILEVELSLNDLLELRDKFPFLRDRREGVF